MPWKNLESIEQFENVLASEISGAMIFKHSTRCSVSRMVLKNFMAETETQPQNIYLLDLINLREVSNHIAQRLNIKHESPQLICIKNHLAQSVANHENILNHQIDSNL
ncbi:MAG: bacillithiol system redox-active protein YtxJ [Bacteroidetes bacterium]|nr:bacillithiol system redox-active protein YtxJ [Bacteroidota bacterium]